MLSFLNRDHLGIKVCQVKNNKTTKENHLNNLCHEEKKLSIRAQQPGTISQKH